MKNMSPNKTPVLILCGLLLSGLLGGCFSLPKGDEEAVSVTKTKKLLYGFYLVDDPEGVVVDNIWRGWPAEEGGLQPGDRVQSINAVAVESVEEALKQVSFHVQQNPRRPLVFSVLREGHPVTLSLTNPRPGPPKKTPEKIYAPEKEAPLGQPPDDAATQSIHKQLEKIQKQIEEDSP